MFFPATTDPVSERDMKQSKIISKFSPQSFKEKSEILKRNIKEALGERSLKSPERNGSPPKGNGMTYNKPYELNDSAIKRERSESPVLVHGDLFFAKPFPLKASQASNLNSSSFMFKSAVSVEKPHAFPITTSIQQSPPFPGDSFDFKSSSISFTSGIFDRPPLKANNASLNSAKYTDYSSMNGPHNNEFQSSEHAFDLKGDGNQKSKFESKRQTFGVEDPDSIMMLVKNPLNYQSSDPNKMLTSSKGFI
jgi:hypothetical protein